MVDNKLVHDSVIKGEGCCPLLVMRFNPSSDWPHGLGPLIQGLPSLRQIDEFERMLLENAELSLTPPITYPNDSFTNVEQGLEPGMAYPINARRRGCDQGDLHVPPANRRTMPTRTSSRSCASCSMSTCPSRPATRRRRSASGSTRWRARSGALARLACRSGARDRPRSSPGSSICSRQSGVHHARRGGRPRRRHAAAQPGAGRSRAAGTRRGRAHRADPRWHVPRRIQGATSMAAPRWKHGSTRRVSRF
jgi:hypothetical protein